MRDLLLLLSFARDREKLKSFETERMKKWLEKMFKGNEKSENKNRFEKRLQIAFHFWDFLVYFGLPV